MKHLSSQAIWTMTMSRETGREMTGDGWWEVGVVGGSLGIGRLENSPGSRAEWRNTMTQGEQLNSSCREAPGAGITFLSSMHVHLWSLSSCLLSTHAYPLLTCHLHKLMPENKALFTDAHLSSLSWVLHLMYATVLCTYMNLCALSLLFSS